MKKPCSRQYEMSINLAADQRPSIFQDRLRRISLTSSTTSARMDRRSATPAESDTDSTSGSPTSSSPRGPHRRPRHIVRWWDALRSFKRSSDNLDIELGRFDFWSRTYAAALLHAEVNLLRFDLEPIDGSTLAMTASNDNWTRTDHINITNSRLLGTAELDAKKRASIIRLVRKHVRDVHG